VVEQPRSKLSWLLVAASTVLTIVLLYVLFVGYLPSRQRVASLERELKHVYARETELQTRVSQIAQRHVVRDRQLAAITAERDALVKRLERLERELAALRAGR